MSVYVRRLPWAAFTLMTAVVLGGELPQWSATDHPEGTTIALWNQYRGLTMNKMRACEMIRKKVMNNLGPP
jgi:hypothetical protein